MDKTKNQKLIMFLLAFFTVFNYAFILLLLISLLELSDVLQDTMLIFGIGAVLSVVSSSFIIRNHIVHERVFEKTIIKLSLAHIPALVGLLYGLFVYVL